MFKVPGLEKEKIYFFVRRHWLGLFDFIIYIAFIVFVTGIFLSMLVGNTGLIREFIVFIWSVILLISMFLATASYIRHNYDVLLLTGKELVKVDQAGILNRRAIHIPLEKIQDITAEIPTFFGEAFKYGTLIIELKNEVIIFPLLPLPIDLARMVMDQYNELAKKNPKLELLQEKEVPKSKANTLSEFTTKDIEEMEFKGSSMTVAKKHPLAREIREEIIQLDPSTLKLTRQSKKGKSWWQIFWEEIFGPPKE